MSSSEPATNPSEPDRRATPSLARELWVLGKVIIGALLVGFACWRVWVFAFGDDESLLFGYRVRAASAADQARLLREHNQALRQLERTTRDLHARADRAEELQRSLTLRLEEQAERDRDGYRTQRWMELMVAAFGFIVGPGLVASGRGVLWRRGPKPT
jgi:hypothetical protein